AAAGYGWFWRPTPRAEDVERQLHSATASDESDAAGQRIQTDLTAKSDKAALLLAAVQQRRDPLRCAHDLYLALQQLEARDFRLLTADPAGVLALAERFEDLPYELQQAFGDSAITRWLEVDPDGALAWFRRMPTIFGKGEHAQNLILRAIAKKRPEEVLGHLLTLSAGERRTNMAGELFGVLASSDPARANQWLSRLPDKASRDAAEKSIRQALAKSDPVAAIDLVANMRDRWEASQLVEVAVESAARRGAGELRNMAAKTTDPRFLMMIFQAPAAYDPEDAARQTSELLANSDPKAGWRALTNGFPEIRRRRSKLRDGLVIVECANRLSASSRATGSIETPPLRKRGSPARPN
ncbi:MAG TPA: hypothetical protein VFD27_14515, partial [Chthoniobacteraceae bacterium]|nr:hypothetical protein [Chthoniobacteraceae bacterium]